jgi:hypothetical protein
MDSVRDIHCWMGCPIRRSRDQRALASTPGFSQRATSFIASRCQGIHQMPLPQRLIAKTRRLQRQALIQMTDVRGQMTEKRLASDVRTSVFRAATMLSREDTHSEEARSQKPEARKPPVSSHPNSLGIHRSIRPAISTTLTAKRRLGSLPLHLSKIKHARAEAPAQTFFPRSRTRELNPRTHSDIWHLSSVIWRAPARLVEVIGIEPTTSCLQSRRSPN